MTCNTSAVAVSSLQRLVTLGFALGKLTLHIGDKLLGIGYRAVGRRTHLRTSSGPTFRADHTVSTPPTHRLSIGTIRLASANGRYLRDPSVPLVRRTAAIGAFGSLPCAPAKVS